MKIKLLRPVMVGGGYVPTPRGSVVDLEPDEAKQFIESGIGEEHSVEEVKKATPVANKAFVPGANKAAGSKHA